MDIVLGVSMEPTAVRMLLIEGANADGATVEEDSIDVEVDEDAASGDASVAQVIAAVIGTREGAVEGGYQLMSTGVTWTDPAQVSALRAELAAGEVGNVMLVSPLLAAAALAQTVGAALDYEHIAMVFVEKDSATLAVVDISDGSIVDLHRQSLKGASMTAGLVTLVAGLDAPESRADGVFLVGCGVDIVEIMPALDAATALVVSGPEEPDMALARGAALASANAPLFASSTSALAYALDPGTGEVNPRALAPNYLDVCAMAGVSEGSLAYSALDDEADDADEFSGPRHRPLALVGAAVAGVVAVVAGVLIVSMGTGVRQTSAQQPNLPDSAGTPAMQMPATELPAQVLLPGMSLPPAAPPSVEAVPPPAAPPPAPPVAPPPVVVQAPPRTVTQPVQAPAYTPPAQQPRRQPIRQAPAPVQAPAQQAAPQPSAPPVAAPAPAAPAAPAAPPAPVMTAYLHLPFVSIPIPIGGPPPPPPPAPAEPGP